MFLVRKEWLNGITTRNQHEDRKNGSRGSSSGLGNLIFLSDVDKSSAFPRTLPLGKVKIMNSSASGFLDLEVYESIKNMTKVFQLEPGDECYFLKQEEWIWRDIKDPAFALAAVFCPKKGGGWAMIPNGR